MIEIINLAFRLVAMSYLGLQDYPLYLDEPGRAFDPAHKSAVVNMVKSLLEQSTFSQIFMISHDYAQYGALANAQLCVMNPTNVVVPKDYNSHVTMR
jgi:ABC-type Mn2+/Zn2+ transport system ATPase subunit